MSYFKKLFGVERSEIKRVCLLMPVLFAESQRILKINKLMKGILYQVGQGDNFTLIYTRMSASFVGDAVLYLGETSCEYLILYGSCASVFPEKIKIGSLVSPYKCYAFEQFSEMLSGNAKMNKFYYPDKDFLNFFYSNVPKEYVRKVAGISVSSLYLEKKYLNYFQKNNIEIIDMECFSFFASAEHIKRKALALFFISDDLAYKPFFTSYEKEDKALVKKAKMMGLNLLWEIMKKL